MNFVLGLGELGRDAADPLGQKFTNSAVRRGGKFTWALMDYGDMSRDPRMSDRGGGGLGFRKEGRRESWRGG